MRIKTKDIKKITAKYIVEANDSEIEPVVAALIIEFTEEISLSKKLILEMIENVGQAFKELFEKEVE